MKSASRVGESLQILILISHFRKKRSQTWFSFDPGEPSEIKILKKFQLFKKHLMTDQHMNGVIRPPPPTPAPRRQKFVTFSVLVHVITYGLLNYYMCLYLILYHILKNECSYNSLM